MRNVSYKQSNWFFNADNGFQGLRTGSDFCTEHEIGINHIFSAFQIERGEASIERFRVKVLPDSFTQVEHDGYFAIFFHCHHDKSHAEKIIENHCRYARDGEPVIAWDEKGFLLMSPLTNQPHTQALKALWEAFQRCDVYLGGDFGDRYHGGGIGFFIGNHMPEDLMQAASDKVAPEGRGGAPACQGN